ncbi:putative pentatricopeptide repeat-containing protein, partial [Tanacetum coccineum]
MYGKIGEKSLVSWNALISSYAQAGLCDEALIAFLKLKNSEKYLVPNVVSWSAIISGFAANGRSNESLNLFRKIQLAKVKPNVVPVSSLLSVCADLSTIHFG